MFLRRRVREILSSFRRCRQCSDDVQIRPTQDGRIIGPRACGNVKSFQFVPYQRINEICFRWPWMTFLAPRSSDPTDRDMPHVTHEHCGFSGNIRCRHKPVAIDFRNHFIVGQKLRLDRHTMNKPALMNSSRPQLMLCQGFHRDLRRIHLQLHNWISRRLVSESPFANPSEHQMMPA